MIMKTIRNIALITMVLPFLLISCEQEEVWMPKDAGLVTFTEMSLETGDSLSVLDGFSNVPFVVQSVGKPSVFVSSAGLDDAVTDVFAVFPYDTTATRMDNSLIFSVPSVQHAVKGGVDKKAARYAAYTSTLAPDTELEFLPVTSYLGMNFPKEAQITAAVFRSVSGEAIAGKAKVSFAEKDDPLIALVDGVDEIRLVSDEPLDGYYVIAVLPSVLQDGLELTVADSLGRTVVRKIHCIDENGVESAISLTRGKTHRCDALLDCKVTARIDDVFWSDMKISWTSLPTPEKYEVRIDGKVVAEVPGSESSCHLKGLENNLSGILTVTAVVSQDSVMVSEGIGFRTGALTQLAGNVSPTSLSFNVENMTGTEPSAKGPCLYVEIYDGPDPATAAMVMGEHIVTLQEHKAGTPFVASYGVDSKKSSPPLNITFGPLEPDTEYWVRVRCEESYTGYSHKDKGEFTVTSAAGTSEFSSMVPMRTGKMHQSSTSEVISLGFDEMTGMYDYMNCAVTAFPEYKEAEMEKSDMKYPAIRDWTGGWDFMPVLPISQLAHIGWIAQQTKTDEVFRIEDQLIADSEDKDGEGVEYPSAGSKIYKFRPSHGSLSGWYVTNNSYACPGYIKLGKSYGSDNKAETQQGMIATPALPKKNLAAVGTRSCVLTFKGLALYGKECTLGVWVYDGAEKTWKRIHDVALENSSGSTAADPDWTALSENHKWYEHSRDLNLKAGDIVAITVPLGNAALIDDICITVK